MINDGILLDVTSSIGSSITGYGTIVRSILYANGRSANFIRGLTVSRDKVDAEGISPKRSLWSALLSHS